MVETPRRFDRGFRGGAVRIVRETAKPIVQVARDLGINEGTLGSRSPASAISVQRDGSLTEDEMLLNFGSARAGLKQLHGAIGISETLDSESSGVSARASRTAAPALTTSALFMYRSWVIDGLEWPSWSAAIRVDSPAPSINVATVLRMAWLVIQSYPAAVKASLRSALVLDGSRRPPFDAGNTRSPVAMARRRHSMAT